MNNAFWMNELDKEFDDKQKCARLTALLKRVIDEGWSSWSASSSDVEIHWSIPKELEREIAKELSDE